MIHQTPLSECLLFDLEAYVPQDQRRTSGLSLAVNPYRSGHLLLGGVFHLFRPLSGEVLTDPAYTHHWSWRDGNEAETVSAIYRIFSGMRERISGKKRFVADPVVSGVGIANFDLPFLYTKCLEHEIDEPAEIYDTVCKFRVVDLSTAAIGFYPTSTLYPIPHNQMADTFLSDREMKPTGKVVWDMVDQKEYGAVEQRCEHEVQEMKGIFEAMTSGKF